MTSRTDLDMKASLLALTNAKKVAAAAEFLEAQAAVDDAVLETEQSAADVSRTYAAWEQGLVSPLLGINSYASLATQLLAAESALVGSRRKLAAVERAAEDRRQQLQHAEARLQAERERLGKARRRFLTKQEEVRLADQADRALGQRGYGR